MSRAQHEVELEAGMKTADRLRRAVGDRGSRNHVLRAEVDHLRNTVAAQARPALHFTSHDHCYRVVFPVRHPTVHMLLAPVLVPVPRHH
jgi:hypothetical protein